MLATDQAHLFGTHIQFHGHHIRLSEREWESLDIAEIHPLIFRNDHLNNSALENGGVRHYASVIERDFGFDPDMMAHVLSHIRLYELLKIVGWSILDIMGSKHISSLNDFLDMVRDAISRDPDPRHNIATMICNQFKGISNDHEAKIKLAELSAQLIPSDFDYAVPFAARSYLRSAGRDQLAHRNNKEKALDIMNWTTPVTTFSWMDQLTYWTDDHNLA